MLAISNIFVSLSFVYLNIVALKASKNYLINSYTEKQVHILSW
jgi:hypothetical protein